MILSRVSVTLARIFDICSSFFQAIACAVDFDDQHCGIYAGDADSYEDFKDVFEPIILEYHGLKPEFSHTSDMDADKIVGNIDSRDATAAL